VDDVSSQRVVPPIARFKVMTLAEYKKVYHESIRDPVSFWANLSRALIWEKPWISALSGKPPRAKWFDGGQLSPYRNVLGRHRDTSVWGRVATIYESEDGDVEISTYRHLDELAGRIAGWLKAQGVAKGDWTLLYAPPCPEAVAFMLASLRVGAPFEPVFTGFGWYELAKRVKNRSPKVIFTVDGYKRRGKEISLLENVKKAVEASNAATKLLVSNRLGLKIPTLREACLLDEALRENYSAESRIVEAGDPIFGLHPGYEEDFKPVSFPVGGYLTQAYATSYWLGLKPLEVLFNTVWPGWITGVTYLALGPLMNGATIVLYDGAPDWRSWDRWFSILESYAVTILLTTSGALRVLSKQSPEIYRKHDYDTLKAILVTAEPLDAETWSWAYRNLGTLRSPVIDSDPSALSGAVPVVNLYIQSEIATFATGNLPSYTFPHIIPGTNGPPIPGFHLDILSDGRLILRSPWPAMPIEAPQEYWERWSEGFYDTGDLATYATDEYIQVLGRRDAVMKINGYRISPGAIEKALETMTGVKRALVAGKPDPQKFEAPVVVIKGKADQEHVRNVIREYISPIADPADIQFAEEIKYTSRLELKNKLKGISKMKPFQGGVFSGKF
jgi:acetyl-CoA synthetase